MTALLRAVLAAVLAAVLVSACTPRVQQLGPPAAAPAIEKDVFVTADGVRLPLRRWAPPGPPRAVLVVLHGFNDYSAFIAEAAEFWADAGILTYAFDQRGFGGAPEPGIWGGEAALVSDARALFALVAARHPGLPVHLLGNSMGGAVALLAVGGEGGIRPDSLILSAPAVWGGRSMNPVFRVSLWLAAHIMPWNTDTGSGLNRQPSDNIAMLRALGRDPLVIKRTRVDAVYGLTNLMGAAYGVSMPASPPVLALFGKRDEILPEAPVLERLCRLPPDTRFVHYAAGYHMLLRDLQAERVWGDIAAWIADRRAPLPSGEEAERPSCAEGAG